MGGVSSWARGILAQSWIFGQTGNSFSQPQEKPEVCTYLPPPVSTYCFT